MIRFANRDEIENFMYVLIRVTPPEQVPDEIVLDEREYEMLDGKNSYQAHCKIIWFRRRCDWNAEGKYKHSLEALEERVRKLEGGR